MENRDVQMVLSASALFHIYDKAGVGEISKYALLSFFSCRLNKMQLLTNLSLSNGWRRCCWNKGYHCRQGSVIFMWSRLWGIY